MFSGNPPIPLLHPNIVISIFLTKHHGAYVQSQYKLCEFVFNQICGSCLTNRHAITMRSSAQRRRLTVRLSRGIERQPGQTTSSAECLMHRAAHASHSAANASHCAAPHPAPPCPAVNVDVGAPSVAPSDDANRAGASEEVDVVDDASHAASGVAASEWLQPILVVMLSPQVVQVPVLA